MIIKPLKLRQDFTRNYNPKAMTHFFIPTSFKNPPFRPTYQTFLNETSNNSNSRGNSFSFLTSNLNSFDQHTNRIITKDHLLNQALNLASSLISIKEENKFNLSSEYSNYQKKQRPTTSISNNGHYYSHIKHLSRKREDAFFEMHKKTSRTNRQTMQFPKRIFIQHEKTASHDANLFNKRYLEKDPSENYVRNSYKFKTLILSRTFVNKIKKDLTSLKFNNKIKVILMNTLNDTKSSKDKEVKPKCAKPEVEDIDEAFLAFRDCIKNRYKKSVNNSNNRSKSPTKKQNGSNLLRAFLKDNRLKPDDNKHSKSTNNQHNYKQQHNSSFVVHSRSPFLNKTKKNNCINKQLAFLQGERSTYSKNPQNAINTSILTSLNNSPTKNPYTNSHHHQLQKYYTDSKPKKKMNRNCSGPNIVNSIKHQFFVVDLKKEDENNINNFKRHFWNQ